MLYNFAKIIANPFYRVFYKLDYRGLDKIPRGKPVVLAPNHVNAFIDAMVIAMLVKQDVHFFARGDVFKNPIAKWVLTQLKMFPMYRLQEGYSELKKNDKTFEICRNLLANNKTLLIFPEAICIQEKRLKPLKKGLSRIIFQTEETFDFTKDVLIVPIGLNYSDAKSFRSKLFIDCGDPISIKEYEERYKQDKVRTINEFTKALEQKITDRLIIIKNKENDDMVTALVQIYLNDWMKEKKADINDSYCLYQSEREIVAMINMMDIEYPELTLSLRHKTTHYSKLLAKAGLQDSLLHPDAVSKMNFGTFLLESITIYLCMPIYWLGLLVNYPPYYIAKKMTYKKVKNVEFLASMYMNITMFLWLVYFAIQLVIAGIVFHNWLLLSFYTSTVIVLGIFDLKFHPLMKKIFGRWRLLRMVRKDRSTVEKLVSNRAEIIEEIVEMKRLFISSLNSKLAEHSKVL